MNLHKLLEMDSRQRNMIAIGLISVVLAAMSVYVVLPEIKEFRSKSASRSALLVATANGKELPQQIEARLHAIEELSRQLHGDSANLPMEQMEAFVIGRLQKISWDHDIELISVRPDEGENIAEFREIRFDIELEGGYAPVHRWLWSVRQELGFVVIKEFSLVRVDQSAHDPRLRATLTMASYRMANT